MAPSKTRTLPPKKAPAAKRPAKRATPPKAKATETNPPFTVEAIPHPVDEDHQAAEQARAELQQPGRVSKADAEQIDGDPGYDKDQLDHMREYWGLDGDVTTPGA